jgi:hypothetical protein
MWSTRLIPRILVDSISRRGWVTIGGAGRRYKDLLDVSMAQMKGISGFFRWFAYRRVIFPDRGVTRGSSALLRYVANTSCGALTELLTEP